jgi:hypothetical protein
VSRIPKTRGHPGLCQGREREEGLVDIFSEDKETYIDDVA